VAAALSCSEAQALLWEYLDGELGPEHSADVRAHVAACRPCRARQESARAFLRAVLGTWHSDAAPPSLRRRVTASLRIHGLLS
jgi:mycothiol system anti-sigma-R factor